MCSRTWYERMVFHPLGESEYKIVVVDSNSFLIDEFDIEEVDLKRSLIGVELYQFDMEIVSKDQVT